MKIGLVNIFAFRPHVEQLFFLSRILQDAGHEVFYLTCDASVGNCYPRELKGSSKFKECTKCILGGVRSYTKSAVTSVVSTCADELPVAILDELALSSSCTLNRTEAETEWNEPKIVQVRESLFAPISLTYFSTVRWIEENSLDGVICFNGRMDLTRAVTYACEQLGVSYITHERPWFSEGLHLTPNANCLSLRAVTEMVAEYDDLPLTFEQARIAGKYIGERFLQRNSLEWRLYNKNPDPTAWPLAASGPRVLVLPSSKNEFAGHAEWKSCWTDNTQALEDFFEAFSIKSEQVVLRCHPNWAEKIGKVGGERSLNLYREWAKKKSIYCISSEQKASTYDLIQQADIVVLNGGSSAVDAGVCGKQVVCLGPSTYSTAGFVRTFMDKDSMYKESNRVDLDSEIIMRKTLRFLYVRSHRHPQFVDFVRPIETTRYNYFQGADVERLINIFRTGKLVADDSTWAADVSGENMVLEMLKCKKWGELANYEVRGRELLPLEIKRRPAFRWVDNVRSKLPRGDRG